MPDFSREELRAEGSRPLPPQFEPFPGVFAKELLLAYHPLSLVPEAYRNLRAELLLSRPAAPPRSLLVTSAMSGEGKTLTALNTAIALAQMGPRVLIIDADLRHPRCHAVFKMSKGPGLTEFLTGQRDLAGVIQTTRVEQLFLVSGGAIPPNPAELLGSKKMQAALAFLNHLYEYIVIDSPPLGLVSDSLLLSSRVDGVVLVVNSQTTHYKVVQGAVARLERARAKILGVVLNKIDGQSREYAEYCRRYRAYYRQAGANEEVVSVVEAKKQGKKAAHGRTAPAKTGRKSPAKGQTSIEPHLTGVAAVSLMQDQQTATSVATDANRESPASDQRMDGTHRKERTNTQAEKPAAVMSSTDAGTPPVNTGNLDVPAQSEDDEETILSSDGTDKPEDSPNITESEVRVSRVDVSQ